MPLNRTNSNGSLHGKVLLSATEHSLEKCQHAFEREAHEHDLLASPGAHGNALGASLLQVPTRCPLCPADGTLPLGSPLLSTSPPLHYGSSFMSHSTGFMSRLFAPSQSTVYAVTGRH